MVICVCGKGNMSRPGEAGAERDGNIDKTLFIYVCHDIMYTSNDICRFVLGGKRVLKV